MVYILSVEEDFNVNIEHQSPTLNPLNPSHGHVRQVIKAVAYISYNFV